MEYGSNYIRGSAQILIFFNLCIVSLTLWCHLTEHAQLSLMNKYFT
jgi:hypothetical protein